VIYFFNGLLIKIITNFKKVICFTELEFWMCVLQDYPGLQEAYQFVAASRPQESQSWATTPGRLRSVPTINMPWKRNMLTVFSFQLPMT